MNIRNFFTGIGVGLAAATLATTAVAQVCSSGQLPVTLPTATASFGPFSGVYGPGDNPDLMLPKFDPTNFAIPPGATLVKAVFSARVKLETFGDVGNQGDAPCTGTWGGEVTGTIFSNPAVPALSPYLDCTKTAQRLENFALNTGGFVNYPLQTVLGNCPTVNPGNPAQTVTITNPADLADFSGPGTLSFPHAAAVSNATTSTCGVFPSLTVLNAFVEVFVQYTYCTEAPPLGDCVCHGPSPHYRRPGSLLLFPEFDNRNGNVTLVTVTNTKCDDNDGDVRVEMRYINEMTCSEDDFTRFLTACDTFTFLTNVHNPNPKQGYLYVFAKDAANNPIVWNHLVGHLLVINGLDSFEYSLNPVVFRGIGSLVGLEQPDGSPTDLNMDGILDLDGFEYEMAPDIITIPRFLGQDNPQANGGPYFESQLILIALSGGQQFTTTLCFIVYNDNEEPFSAEYTFYCWDKPYLRDISLLFENEFLKTTNHAANEIFGADHRESGWICINGCVAQSSQTTIQDPAFYAVLVERVGSYAAASLPWECGQQNNGKLLPRDL